MIIKTNNKNGNIAVKKLNVITANMVEQGGVKCADCPDCPDCPDYASCNKK